MEKPDLIARLKQSGRLKPAELARISKHAEEKGIGPEAALLELGLLPEEELAYFLCEVYNLPFYRLRDAQVPAKPMKLLGLERMERELVVPVSLRPEGLTVACFHPERVGDLTPLVDYFRVPVNLVVAPGADLRALVGRLKAQHDSQGSEHPLEPSTPSAAPRSQSSGPASDTELMRLLGKVLLEASRGRVSDVHLMQGAEGLDVRFRRDGILEDRTVPMAGNDQLRLVDLVKRLAGMDPREKRLPRTGKMRLPVADRDEKRDLTLKVACAPTLSGERLALRVLEAPDRRFSAEELGFSRPNLHRFRRLLKHPSGGLVLVAGPVKSGRSTTLAAALAEVPSQGVAVFSVEDPVEQKLAGVCQMQADSALPATSKAALVAAAVEQDADVLMIGELSDPDCVRQGLAAAFGGCLVLAGVTANDAHSALRLLLERGAEPFLLGTAVRGVVAQRLLRKLCTTCRRAVYRMPEEVVRVKEAYGLKGTTLFEPVGCDACGFRGYAGRTAIQEVLVPTKELAAAIESGASPSVLGRILADSHHRTLAHDGYEKTLQGVTTFTEVRRILPAFDAAEA